MKQKTSTANNKLFVKYTCRSPKAKKKICLQKYESNEKRQIDIAITYFLLLLSRIFLAFESYS